MTADTRTVGVFIDAENLPRRVADRIFMTAANFGRVIQRRVYGNFANETLRPWMDVVPRHALSVQTTPVSVSGKNSSDILLAVDVTELLCGGGIDVFVIASSDSDFGLLASRIRMRGHLAIGVGRCKVSDSFKQAFDEYHEVDGEDGRIPPAAPKAKVVALRQADIRPYIVQGLEALAIQPGDWVDVGRLSLAIRQQHPNFSPKSFGSAKFSTVLKACGFLEVRMKDGQGMQARLKTLGEMPQHEMG